MVMDWYWDEREYELHTKKKGLGWPKFITYYMQKVQKFKISYSAKFILLTHLICLIHLFYSDSKMINTIQLRKPF